MEKPKKRQKYGGRTKGTPNKKSLIILESIEEYGLNPIEGLRACLEELEAIVTYDSEEQISLVNAKSKIYLEILQYVYPKRKAVEMKQSHEGTINQVIQVQWADEVEVEETVPEKETVN